ncbi:MAG: Clp protease N-terminal domain-containing protein, partial [Actinomycetota bacterium]
MFERFTDDARRALEVAHTESRALRHTHLGTEHLLLGLASVDGSASARILRGFGLDAAGMRASVLRVVGGRDERLLGLD